MRTGSWPREFREVLGFRIDHKSMMENIIDREIPVSVFAAPSTITRALKALKKLCLSEQRIKYSEENDDDGDDSFFHLF